MIKTKSIVRFITGMIVFSTLPVWLIGSVIGWLFIDYFFLDDWMKWILKGE